MLFFSLLCIVLACMLEPARRPASATAAIKAPMNPRQLSLITPERDWAEAVIGAVSGLLVAVFAFGVVAWLLQSAYFG